MVTEEVLTTEEIAQFLCIGKNTIHSSRWKVKSKCPVFRRGRRLYVVKNEFLKWFRNGPQFSLTDVSGGVK